MDAFEAAGVALVALSYDEPDALADFASANGITYPMLADPDSEVITAFGILNTLIPEDEHPWYGIPFPGTYVTDADGIITAKFFENSLAVRVSGAQLVRAATGEVVELEPARGDDPVVAAVAAFDPSPLAAGVQRELVVDLAVPSGQHVYGLPVPDGMVHAHVVLDDGPWKVHAVDAPATHPHVLAGTGDELQIYPGSVRLYVAVSHNASERGDITIAGEIRWQACDDDQCFLPQRQRFELPVHATGARWMQPEHRHEGENFVAHFHKMEARRG